MDKITGQWNLLRLLDKLQSSVKHEFIGLFFLGEAVQDDERGDKGNYNAHLKHANNHFAKGLESFIEQEFLGWDTPEEETTEKGENKNDEIL